MGPKWGMDLGACARNVRNLREYDRVSRRNSIQRPGMGLVRGGARPHMQEGHGRRDQLCPLFTGRSWCHRAVKKNEQPVLTGPLRADYISAINDGVAGTEFRR